MNLTFVQIEFLRHLARNKASQKSASAAASFFHDQVGLGQQAGRRFLYGEADHARAATVLRNHGVSLEPTAKGLRRADAPLHHNANEKRSTLGPHADSIPLKGIAGNCLLDGNAITREGYSVFSLEKAMQVTCSRLLVVENMETFRLLERNRWIDYRGHDVLAVQHGDIKFHHGKVREFLHLRTEPIWAYFDFDPAGLGMASGMPRLEQVVLPPVMQLIDLARRAQQVDLFVKSLGQWSATLELDVNQLIRPHWDLMKSLRLGLSQEFMDRHIQNLS